MEGLNPGISLDECYETWFCNNYTLVNAFAVKNCVQALGERRCIDKPSKIASLLRAVTCLDLTTLCGDDSSSNVQRLCFKAQTPINEEILQSLGINPSDVSCGAVCVYPSKVSKCVETLRSLESTIPVAAVAAGFPSGQYHLKTRLQEIKCCIEDGAREIDIVISRDLVLNGEWKTAVSLIKMSNSNKKLLKVSKCVETLRSLESTIPVAAVAAGFPSGQYHLKTRLQEIKCCIEDGAREIDIVISRDLVLNGEWKKLYAEVKKMRDASEGATLKTIIATGELGSLTNVYKASLICMAAGTDFIKTSTGKETVNATLPVGTVMTRAIKDYYEETGFKVGFKPAGGIRTSQDVLLWQELMRRELDSQWLESSLFRIGASSLLGDIEKTIVQFATGTVGKPLLPFL